MNKQQNIYGELRMANESKTFSRAPRRGFTFLIIENPQDIIKKETIKRGNNYSTIYLSFSCTFILIEDLDEEQMKEYKDHKHILEMPRQAMLHKYMKQVREWNVNKNTGYVSCIIYKESNRVYDVKFVDSHEFCQMQQYALSSTEWKRDFAIALMKDKEPNYCIGAKWRGVKDPWKRRRFIMDNEGDIESLIFHKLVPTKAKPMTPEEESKLNMQFAVTRAETRQKADDYKAKQETVK